MFLKNRQTFILILFTVISTTGFAQNISGNWYGVGNVDKNGMHSQYLSELILTQKGNKISGEYNYFFKSTYIPSKVSGTYNSETRVLELNIFPLLNYKAANINGADCPMVGSFILKMSKIETTLTGLFETTDRYQYTCPSIALRLKKEVKPAIEKLSAITEDNALKNVIENNNPAQVKGAKGVKVKEVATVKKTDSNSLKTTNVPGLIDNKAVQVTPKPPIDPNEAITRALNKRSFEESTIIEVEADSLKLTLYDNGEVDGDTIALFHNRKLVFRGQRLSDKPIAVTIPIDTTVNEISMYAENLGAISPNTALCVIMVGEKRYELTLTSTFIKNGAIRFRKKTAAQLKAEKEYY